MKKRVIKLIVCVMLISALMIGFCSAYASAATPVWLLRAKAGIAAAMLAANLVLEPVSLVELNAVEQAVDPLNIVQTIGETHWEDYIDRSTIVVRPDKVVIDGVPYSEIWLGPDAADSLRLNGLDFVTAYNILSNQSEAVTYATGAGFIDDNPIFNVNGNNRSQYYLCDFGTYMYNQDLGCTFTDNSSSPESTFVSVGSSIYYDGQSTSVAYGSYNRLSQYSSNVYFLNNVNLNTGRGRFNAGAMLKSGIPQVISDKNVEFDNYSNSSFRFDYTSGEINDDPLPEGDGLLMRVPSSYDGGQGSVSYDIHDLINIYPQVNDTNGHELVFDPTLNPDFDVDLDMGNALGDIISAVIVAKLLDLLGDNADVIYAPMPEKDDPGPVDPDLPDPDVPIGDQDPIWMDDLLRWIKNAIDSLGDRIHDALDTIHEDIQEIISQIEELADKILEDIELGPAKLFDKALDILKTLFLPLLLPIRAMMNLWHYVVEWIQSVSSPFTWIFGIMSGTSGNMVLPIYALLAGGICISIYKALGR